MLQIRVKGNSKTNKNIFSCRGLYSDKSIMIL